MLKLFSGTANRPLSEKISAILNDKLGDSAVVRFANSEVKVRVTEKVKDATCVIIQPTANPTDTHLMELFFFADALKRVGAFKIVAVIPYFGYARQNREHLPGEAVSVNVIIRFIENMDFGKVITVNLHDEATEGIFTVPFEDLSAFSILGKSISEYLKDKKSEVAVVSPDQGGVERAQNFADNFFGEKDVKIAVIEKKRNLEKIHESSALDLFGDVRGKICVLVDDIITSGGTLVHAAKLCIDRGATKVIAAVVHHDFALDAPKILQESPIEKIFTTDTILLTENQQFPKLVEVTIAQLLADEIKKLL